MCSKCGCLFGQSPVIHLPVRSHHQHGIDIWDTIECYDVVPSLITLHPAVVGGNRCSWCCLTRFPRCCVVTTPKTSVCNRCWNMFSLPGWWAPFFCHFKEKNHESMIGMVYLEHNDWCFTHVSNMFLLNSSWLYTWWDFHQSGCIRGAVFGGLPLSLGCHVSSRADAGRWRLSRCAKPDCYISAMESLSGCISTCSRIRFTFHFTICTKTKTNFEPSPNPGLVSDPVIFFWSIWKRTKTWWRLAIDSEGFLVRRFGPDFRKVFRDDRFSSYWWNFRNALPRTSEWSHLWLVYRNY